MTKKTAVALFISLLLVIAGCKQDMDNTKLAPYMYAYIPEDIGHSVTYDVDSISYIFVYCTPQVIDTTYYQLKEVILDTLTPCQLGTPCYHMAEYKRYDTTQPYPVNYQSWYFYTTRTTYVADQNDLPIEKFVFPPIVGITWLGNSLLPANDTIADTYQNYAGWNYTFTSVNAPATVNGHFFDSAAVVSDVLSQNYITDVLSTETYALHIGLVFRQWEVITKQSIASTWANPDSAVGFRVLTWYHGYTP